MALQQLLGKRDQIVDNAGAPLAGGLVNLYEPNTLNRITSYSDSALTVQNANPVVLSGAGRANIWISRNCDVRITDKDGNLIVEELAANPDDLGGEFDSGLIPNGSFETDADADDVPDGWTSDVNDPGSNNGLDTSESTSGGQSWRTQSTGSGGGELITTDFFPVNETDDLRVNFDLRATVAAVRNIVRVQWYDVSQVFISNSDVYDSTANPTSFTSQNTLATPPAGARFAKVRIIGGTTGGILAGSTFWDNFRVFYPQVVAGAFDNITIQNNEIVSTNTNGDIAINPNGTGNVELQKDTNVTGTFSVSLTSTLTGAVSIEDTSSVDLSDAVAALRIGPGASPHLEVDPDDIQAKTNATTQNELRINRLGGNVQIGPQSGTGSVHLWEAGVERLATDLSGSVDLKSDGNTDTQERRLRFAHQDGTVRALIGHLTTGDFRVRNAIHGSPILLEGEDAGGTVRTMIQATPGGDVEIYRGAGDKRLATGSGHIEIFSSGNTDAEGRRIDFMWQNGSRRAFFGFAGDGIVTLRNEVHGEGVKIQAENASGVNRNLVVGDPDGAVELYYSGTLEFATVADTGALTGANLRHRDGALYPAGLGVIPTVAVSVSQSLTSVHWNKSIQHNSTTAHTFTLDAANDIGDGAVMWVKNFNTGDVTLEAGTGITLRYFDGVQNPNPGTSFTVTVPRGAWATIHKNTSSSYDVVGVGTTGTP